MKRSFTLILALLALAVGLSACDKQQADSGDTSVTTAAPETEAPAEDIVLIENGQAAFSIVRSEYANQTAIDAAIRLRELIGDKTEVFPLLGTDWHKRDTELDHSKPEILVGATEFSESSDAMAELGYGDYIVTRVGEKLVINAWSEVALGEAINQFGSYIRQNGTVGELILPGDFCLTGTALPILNTIPQYADATLQSVYHAGDNNQVVILGDTDPDEYAAYLRALEADGYTLYTENKITDNLFATYINEEQVVNAGYYAYNNEARIIVEPRETLPPLESENRYQKVIEPSFAMLGLEFDNGGSLTTNGQCFIYQLSDGSYILVDGGLSRARDAQAIYDYLRKHAPDPNNITIAAWFITHAHGDHHGAYATFSKTYAEKVKVELIVGNFPAEEARLAGGLGTDGNGGPTVMTYTKRFDGAEFIKAHVGHKFFLRDAEIEILYTLESYAPGVLDYFNTSSLVFTVDLGGQRFLVTGDASNAALKITTQMYGDHLKSDFVQVAHHGGSTGSTGTESVSKTYTLAASPVVLWPTGLGYYPNRLSSPANKTILELASTKEIFVAGSREVRFTLPYAVGTSGLESILQ